MILAEGRSGWLDTTLSDEELDQRFEGDQKLRVGESD